MPSSSRGPESCAGWGAHHPEGVLGGCFLPVAVQNLVQGGGRLVHAAAVALPRPRRKNAARGSDKGGGGVQHGDMPRG
eukprot:3334958-Pyramimonas_sp.AAC.3